MKLKILIIKKTYLTTIFSSPSFACSIIFIADERKPIDKNSSPILFHSLLTIYINMNIIFYPFKNVKKQTLIKN